MSALSNRDRERLLRRNTRRVLRLEAKHQGETVFVVGSGPQLNSLSPTEVTGLERRPAIAVNRVQYRVRTPYFLSAYPAEVYLATRRLHGSTVLHMRREYEPPLIRGSASLRRVLYELGDTLPSRFDPAEPTLRTRRNVALGASHLALILGARQVVYVGVEQRNALHFFDTAQATRKAIRADLETIPDRDLCHRDHPRATFAAMMERLETPPETLATLPFYKAEHTATFRDYFAAFSSLGVEVFTTTQAGVTVDAGAAYRPLGDFL